ncbi:MAG TPA: ABC transporter substrate-binding protein [Candidatus Saccharimonadia bacterium]|nr:ABC transporter substrate-binding protein [Candidatus Saccharimonadia bacterium]
MKRIRTWYWYTTAFLRKQWLTLIIVGVISILLFHFLSSFILANLPEGKTTRYIGRVGSITLSRLPLDIQEKISDGLTTIGKDTTPLPALAERWSVEDDGKTYRFVLKKNLKWQDGKTVVPSDISYNFSDAQVVTNQNEVVFKLKEPFSPFPTVVSQPIFRQKNNTIIGTGAYKVTQVLKDGPQVSQIAVESNKEKLIYRFYPTEERAIIAFKLGQVDQLENMSQVADLSDWKNVKINQTIRDDEYLAIFFNMSDTTLNKDMRQALNYALPKVHGDERALTPINSLSWAYNKTVKTYDQDDERAVELMLRGIPGTPIVIELTTTTNFQSDAEAIKSHWESMGNSAYLECTKTKAIVDKSGCINLKMQVNLRLVGFPDLSNFQVVLIGQEAPPDPDQYFLWDSTQSTNFTQYKSPRIDKLLEDGRKQIDPEERKNTYLDFQQFLVEDTPAIFLRHLKVFSVMR